MYRYITASLQNDQTFSFMFKEPIRLHYKMTILFVTSFMFKEPKRLHYKMTILFVTIFHC